MTRPGTHRTNPAQLDGARQEALRDYNLATVFSHIAHAPAASPPSRADVATAVGLTKATVSALVDQLISAWLVEELPPLQLGRAGRPATPLRLARRTMVGLGLEVNADYRGLRAIDLSGQVVAEWIEYEDMRGSDPTIVLSKLSSQAQATIEQLAGKGMRLAGTGLALPGLADHPSGPLRLAPNLGWGDVNVRRALAGPSQPAAVPGTSISLATQLTKRLIVDNEANLAAQVEADRRAESGDGQTFIYVSGEIGIGAAIVVDGQVFGGSHGWAGEIGHVVVDPNGPLCACGSRGCLEVYAGKAALMRSAGLADDAGPEDLLAAAAASSQAHLGLQRAAGALGMALASGMNLVDVSEVVLGGDFAPLAEVLAGPIGECVHHQVLAARWLGADVSVRPALAGDHPALTGAALTALRRVIQSPADFMSRTR